MALTDGLVALYHFNNDWQDASGNGNHLTAGGGATFTTSSKFGSHAALFDGIDDYAIKTSPSNLPFGASDRTLAFWMWTDDNSTLRYPVSYGSLNPLQHCCIAVSGGFLYFAFWGDDLIVTAPSVNQWHLIVGRLTSGNKIRLYVDNILAGEKTLSGNANTSASALNIGRRVDGLAPYRNRLDEFLIFNRGLEDGNISVGQTAGGEVAQLWNSGNGFELGGAISGRRRRVLSQGGIWI